VATVLGPERDRKWGATSAAPRDCLRWSSLRRETISSVSPAFDVATIV
jgi:hypothetical protein